MPRTLFIFALLVMLAAAPALADDEYDACAAYPDVPVVVTPRFDPPVYDYAKDIAAITALSSDTRHSIHETMTLGLTRYEPIIRVKAPLSGVERSDGLACTHVKNVNVTVGYEKVVVSIAREFPQGTCGFNEIMAHEQKHIAVNQQILEDYAPRIQAELSVFLKNEGVRQEQDMSYAMQLIKQKMGAIVTSILNDMADDNALRQKAVDSPQEYARIGAACNGQMRTAAWRFMLMNKQP